MKGNTSVLHAYILFFKYLFVNKEQRVQSDLENVIVNTQIYIRNIRIIKNTAIFIKECKNY